MRWGREVTRWGTLPSAIILIGIWLIVVGLLAGAMAGK